jgi:Myb-like DNA-binding domain
MAVQHRGTNWTPEEDRRLLDLIEAGKSWVFISTNLKRPVKTIRDRISQMRRSGLSQHPRSTIAVDGAVSTNSPWGFALKKRPQRRGPR